MIEQQQEVSTMRLMLCKLHSTMRRILSRLRVLPLRNKYQVAEERRSALNATREVLLRDSGTGSWRAGAGGPNMRRKNTGGSGSGAPDRASITIMGFAPSVQITPPMAHYGSTCAADAGPWTI
jgi:hypothetical protein